MKDKTSIGLFMVYRLDKEKQKTQDQMILKVFPELYIRTKITGALHLVSFYSATRSIDMSSSPTTSPSESN